MAYEIEFRADLGDAASVCLRSVVEADGPKVAFDQAQRLASLIKGADGFILWGDEGEPLAIEKLNRHRNDERR